MEQGEFSDAEKKFKDTLVFAREHDDKFLASTALLNLSVSALQQRHFDDAITWAEAARVRAEDLGADGIGQVASGNIGWGSYELGDTEKALQSFIGAQKSAERLGDVLRQVVWLTAIGYVDLQRSEYGDAERSYQQALNLAQQIHAEEYIRNALIPLSIVYEREKELDKADQYANRAIAMAKADGNRLDELYPLLVKGQVAAQRNDSSTAGKIFREVADDRQSDPSLKWEAQHSLARLEQTLGNKASANREYQAALCTFETERSSLRHEESKLPFFTNAERIYEDYVSFLVSSGNATRALEQADYSRARTLAEGLGWLRGGSPCSTSPLNPEQVAARQKATVLYYSLGREHSYFWAITSRKVQLFTLPQADQIDAAVHRYRNAVVGGEDVLATSNADGSQLYKTLIAPAAPLLRDGARVVIVPDGSLNSLNFETLLVPGASSPHYWIEDATISNAHSLRLLSAKTSSPEHKPAKLLLIGDPLPHEPDYPALPNAKLEIQDVEKHFGPADSTVYEESSATPAEFLSSKPGQYAYIHFVAHAVASSQVPLDSAVILSSASGGDSFKLYARDIIQHPLRARLVTVSACYGAGTRSYNGEGLVGLSWAFLRAGAQNTIGALWEVNDASTPQLMDYFYSELQKGSSPEAALRAAKLALIGSNKVFAKPFYWAPFQLYGGS